MTRIDLLLGRTPGPGSVLPGVLARLRGAGAEVRQHHAASFSPEDCLGSDLLVLRGLGRSALLTAVALEAAGTRCANPAAATLRVRDKVVAAAALRRAGLPVPRCALAEAWSEVARLAARRDVVVKAVTGSRGTGVLLVGAGDLPVRPPFAGPWLVEERVHGDGVDRKLYVVGDEVSGVLRVWPPRTLADKRGRALAVPRDLEDLARAAARALDLGLSGVDVVLGEAGPVVVDVNAFPGYKGVEGAADRIARHLLGEAAAQTGERTGPAATARAALGAGAA
jgi:ribosomal protein S6--L-glutamate ligase